MRKAGILLAVSSLPSDYGVGDFGNSCFRFIDDLKKAGCSLWQILPLNPLGYGNSPYQAYSSKAMDDLYISLDELLKKGLIKKTKKFNANKCHVDYEEVRKYKQAYYLEAFENFQPDQEYEKFIQQEWVYRYAVFLTLKKYNGMKIWNEWPEDQKNWIKNHEYDLGPHETGIQYEMFIQYTLYQQWMKVKRYANENGIEIIGDLPFYVGIDSEDVWSNQKAFLLDDQGRPSFIAGVPPDYFSETGQRWGNPLYDWDYLRENDFDFWYDRLNYNAVLFDLIRIDHFRAFDTYWKIPASCPTAIEGEWVEAYGYELFDLLLEKIHGLNIIAEDLGDLRLEVLKLRDHYHFPGMKVAQFTFNPYTPYANDEENMVAFTGTHDNPLTRTWFTSQSYAFKRRTKTFFSTAGYDQDTITDQFIAYVLNSRAKYAIFPMQDFLNLDNRSRMNTPGTTDQRNWRWKMSDFKKFEKKLDDLNKWIKEAKR